MSPQPPQTLSLSQVMQENFILAYYAQIRKFSPRLLKNGIFQKKSFFWTGHQISLPTSPQPPPYIKFKSSYARKRDYAQIWKFSPRLPKMELFKKIHFFEKVSRCHFQQALRGIKTRLVVGLKFCNCLVGLSAYSSFKTWSRKRIF